LLKDKNFSHEKRVLLIGAREIETHTAFLGRIAISPAPDGHAFGPWSADGRSF
jgi:hypothetical protein